MALDKDYNLIVGLRIREVRESMHLSREKFSEICDIYAAKKASPPKPSTRSVMLSIFLPIILFLDIKKDLIKTLESRY